MSDTETANPKSKSEEIINQLKQHFKPGGSLDPKKNQNLYTALLFGTVVGVIAYNAYWQMFQEIGWKDFVESFLKR